MNKEINPIIRLDYPDPDVIRVGGTYYMISTTMHFFPGGEILRSYNLKDWEHASFLFEHLDGTEAQKMQAGLNIYGKGMWAPSFRYYDGIFYVAFSCNDTHKTYLYRSKAIEGPWVKNEIEGFYHDCSLLFDDGRNYIVYGNRQIYITELNKSLTGPKEGGLNRLIIKDSDEAMLGYEGSHIYKIEGRYYIFLIHSLKERWKRVEAIYSADSLEDEFKGGDVLNDDIGYLDSGVAQGGVVDTPSGKYYAILFQDRGASGRIPVLIPANIVNGEFVIGNNGKVPEDFEIEDLRPGYSYEPLASSDYFDEFNGDSFGLRSIWQFNHEPDLNLIELDDKKRQIRIKTGRLTNMLTDAVNIITQRLYYPGCCVSVEVDAKELNDGDYAGLCVLQYEYAYVALSKENGILYKVTYADGEIKEKLKIEDKSVKLSFTVDFEMGKDEVTFDNGIKSKLYFKIEHFVGNRAGLFVYSTKNTGGKGAFSDFRMESKF